ncbi:TPA: hypothetical protein V0B87_000053 [Streptococcus pneumoniae]|nr:hypothetical protein [Streptococcus pneumoniae]
MYIISIYVKNNETEKEEFSILGRDFLPAGEQDYSATIFETKEEAIAYLKSASYEATGAYGNDWAYKDKTSSGVESRCRIWKIGE